MPKTAPEAPVSDEALAQLVKNYAAAVKALQAGSAMTAEERAEIERELGIRKRGRRKDPRVAAREAEISRRMDEHYRALERGETDIGITRFVWKLVGEYQGRGRRYSDSDIWRVFARHRAATGQVPSACGR